MPKHRYADAERDRRELLIAKDQMPSDGCVTNFNHGAQRLTIWKSGDAFRLEEYGVGGAILPETYMPLFQSLAAEIHRLAGEVGRLSRVEIELNRKLDRVDSMIKRSEESAFDAGMSEGWNQRKAEERFNE